MPHFDYLIVGAGFTGAVLAERLASQLDKRVLVVDRRPHIAGNAFDAMDDSGVLVHRYGPHIFHTNSAKVFHYLSQFTAWRPYEHRVLGVLDGKMVTLPINLDSLTQLFPAGLAARYAEALISAFGFGSKVPILKLRQSDDTLLQELAEFVYQKVFYNYTKKQWGLSPEELSPSVTGRVPVRISRDDRYFTDRYQAMPKAGYTEMFRRLLSHPNVQVLLGADGKEASETFSHDHLVFTGPIDQFLGYVHGPLPYRSIRFEVETLPIEQYQPVGTVNYPNAGDFTRITEQKHLTGQRLPVTTIVREFPQAYDPAVNEPYYPVPIDESKVLYAKYLETAREEFGERVRFAGRLGDYKYYNMDQACARALALFDSIAKENGE